MSDAKELIRLLLVDDSEEDRKTYQRALQKDPLYAYVFHEADTGEEGIRLCQRHKPDCILVDYQMPDLNGLDFLVGITEEWGVVPYATLILTGQGSESIAVEAMKRGAQDYIVKGMITPDMLQRAVHSAVERVSLRKQLTAIQQEKDRLIDQLQVALDNIKTLRGLIPICAACKKIRDDQGYWKELETYLQEHSEAKFSHGYCPNCAARILEENRVTSTR